MKKTKVTIEFYIQDGMFNSKGEFDDSVFLDGLFEGGQYLNKDLKPLPEIRLSIAGIQKLVDENLLDAVVEEDAKVIAIEIVEI